MGLGLVREEGSEGLPIVGIRKHRRYKSLFKYYVKHGVSGSNLEWKKKRNLDNSGPGNFFFFRNFTKKRGGKGLEKNSLAIF